MQSHYLCQLYILNIQLFKYIVYILNNIRLYLILMENYI